MSNASSREQRRESPAPGEVRVTGGFWGSRLAANRNSLLHQWERFERTGRLDNFRVAAGTIEGFRKGFFYDDSDVHKWAEAASLALAAGPDREIERLLNEYIDLVRRAADPDGYLFTYNQCHFPGVRWKNLQIEHELYTMGHLIEAGVSHREATGSNALLSIALAAGDIVARDFKNAGPTNTPGHEEIEIALIRLYRLTGRRDYLDTARRFIEDRGKTRFFGLRLAGQFLSQGRRAASVRKRERAFTGASGGAGFDFTEQLGTREPPFLKLRSTLSFLSGAFFQQHRPVRKQRVPKGHAVRWGYLATAAAMLSRETDDGELLGTLAAAWRRMVTRRIYVTGGIGSLPVIEGFGRDFELDNRYAYCETCAALASIFWSREMLLATSEAHYADLIEWQIYNAALPGIGLDGRSYLYRNPLVTEAIARKPWFGTACCPGNIARAWASLGEYVFSRRDGEIMVHQYVDCEWKPPYPGATGIRRIAMTSDLPLGGAISIEVSCDPGARFALSLRIPSWACNPSITLNGLTIPPGERPAPVPTASGYSPFESYHVRLNGPWKKKNRIQLDLPMEIRLLRSDPRLRGNRGRVALTRGPLVYCAESVDNPGVAVPGAVLDLSRPLEPVTSVPHFSGACAIRGAMQEGTPLTFIPYYAWGNRGASSMEVWVRTGGEQSP